ncbi:hypothetical protein AMAG_00995 [Allomyces macrogynus ATCC 38327]|uniref:F-box domain-containing protein n=1 Tax=Allomyces macrogynus (strain ATCC 38327) TaxID=578462 RepID=A0A0L0RYA2_ALLM3|nr:hypothetical protein AMAG_00995 [Allomyces macrogynus ATCC 38327]|eukprot:KNE55059.1 hypothetical protein AMAG_00995 [Allomyces macrogynus ATCC 38327]
MDSLQEPSALNQVSFNGTENAPVNSSSRRSRSPSLTRFWSRSRISTRSSPVSRSSSPFKSHQTLSLYRAAITSAQRLLQANAFKMAKLEMVAHHVGTAALLLASVYSWPYTLCKGITYLRAIRRRRFPLVPWPRIAWSMLTGQPMRELESNRPQSSKLLALPPEVFTCVMDHLHAEDLAKLATTCQQLCVLVNSDLVWASMIKRDFRTRGARWFPESMPAEKRPAAKDQYRELVESAVGVGLCSCVRDPLSPRARDAPPCCYTSFIYTKRTEAPWYRRWSVTWREIHGGWPAVVTSMRARATADLLHILLTPLKIVGVVVALPLLPIALVRLRFMRQTNGMWGHQARELYLGSLGVFTDGALVLDAQWLLFTVPMCAMALVLCDMDRAVTWLWESRKTIVVSVVQLVAAFSLLGVAVRLLSTLANPPALA